MAIDMQDDLFSVARLGQKKENGKPRRIIVRCCNEADRDKIMARKHNLKTIQNGRFERVYIHEDLTVAQREELFNMYKSAEAKNSIGNGTTKWIVCGRRTNPFIKEVRMANQAKPPTTN